MNCCRRRQPAHHLRRPTPAELPRRYLSACCRSTIISRPHRIEFQIAQLLALYVRNEGGKEKKHSFKADRLDGPTPPCIFFPFSVPKKPRDYALDFPSRDCEFRRCFRLSRSSGDRRFRPGLWRVGGRHVGFGKRKKKSRARKKKMKLAVLDFRKRRLRIYFFFSLSRLPLALDYDVSQELPLHAAPLRHRHAGPCSASICPSRSLSEKSQSGDALCSCCCYCSPLLFFFSDVKGASLVDLLQSPRRLLQRHHHQDPFPADGRG